MAQSQNVIREIIVGNAIASETTLPTFLSTASPLEIAVVAADGTAPGFGKDFYVVTKAPNGQLIKSDLVKAKTVSRLEGVPYVAPVQKVVDVGTITVPANAGAKASYQVQIRVFNAGSLSVLNTEFIIGHYTFTQTSAPLTAEAVVDGLIANLNANMSKRPGATATTNPYFSFTKNSTGAGASLRIASIAQPIDLGRSFGRPLEFEVTLIADDPGASGVVSTITPATVGKGSGAQVATLEYFYRGERGDQFRNQHFPYNWSLSTKTLTNPASNYNAVEINHSNGNENGINAVIVPKELTIAVAESSGTTLMEALIADIEVFAKGGLDSLLGVTTTGATDGDVLTFSSGAWGPDEIPA